MGAAMDQAIAVITDAFRPERKGANQRMIECLRLKELVTSHHCTFPDALAKLETQIDWIKNGIAWLNINNGYLNRKHGTHSFHLAKHEIDAIEWLGRVTGEA